MNGDRSTFDVCPSMVHNVQVFVIPRASTPPGKTWNSLNFGRVFVQRTGFLEKKHVFHENLEKSLILSLQPTKCSFYGLIGF